MPKNTKNNKEKTEIKSIINEKNISNADVVFLSCSYDKTASSHKGTAMGPKKVIEMLESQIEFYDRSLNVEMIDYIKTAHKDMGNLNKFSPDDVLRKIHATAEELVNMDKFVFVLGGEHSVPLGLYQTLADKYDPKDVTILQIDAHLDMRNDDSDYSKNPTHLAHSTIMRRAHELGFNIINVGARSFSKAELDYANSFKNIKVFQFGHPTKKPEKEEILKAIKTKYLYITIDVDGFDPAVMPGTGTPVPGGLKWNYGMNLITKAINKKGTTLIGADIMEVSPQKETVITEYTSAQLAYSIICEKFKTRVK